MDASRIALFWSRVDVRGPDECWKWKLRPRRDGYGQTTIEGTWWQAHRAAYLLHYGELSASLQVLHSCDNPLCCNPQHLRQGTRLENMRDMVERGRARKDWSNGRAKLNPAKAEQIRALYAQGTTVVGLGRAFGVAPKTIRDVVQRKLWK